MNRKKFSNINNNQGYRFGNPSNTKYGAQNQQQNQQQQQQQQHSASPMIANHFKQTYPQLYYNSSNNGSNISLDQINSAFYGSNHVVTQQRQVSSGNSSPSLAMPKLDTSLSGTSSIASYNGSFDPISSEFNAQFTSPAAFSNYLGGGLMNPGPTLAPSGPTSATIPSARNDLLPNFSSTSLANDTTARGSMVFDPKGPAPTVGSDTIVPNPAPKSSQDNTFNNVEGSTAEENNNTSNQFFMNDFTIDWGSSHVNGSSSNSGSFGIWSNDMSVWS